MDKDIKDAHQMLNDQRELIKKQGGVGGHSRKRKKTEYPLPQLHPFAKSALHYASHIAPESLDMLPLGTQTQLNPSIQSLILREKELLRAIQLVEDHIPPKHRGEPLSDLQQQLKVIQQQIQESK
ncbi:hypothetical protein D3C87_125130 [compost metagenome]